MCSIQLPFEVRTSLCFTTFTDLSTRHGHVVLSILDRPSPEETLYPSAAPAPSPSLNGHGALWGHSRLPRAADWPTMAAASQPGSSDAPCWCPLCVPVLCGLMQEESEPKAWLRLPLLCGVLEGSEYSPRTAGRLVPWRQVCRLSTPHEGSRCWGSPAASAVTLLERSVCEGRGAGHPVGEERQVQGGCI